MISSTPIAGARASCWCGTTVARCIARHRTIPRPSAAWCDAARCSARCLRRSREAADVDVRQGPMKRALNLARAAALLTACGLCIGAVSAQPSPRRSLDLQGHRGARGLAPENTMAAFRRAQAIGVTTLETDVAI